MRKKDSKVLKIQPLVFLEKFFKIEAASGIILLIAAIIGLIWANSPFANTYHSFWETQFSIGFGKYIFSQSFHFWINDGLMTIFFLVVGMEIRREIHEGALSNLKQATLPIAAAIGGVIVPALFYLSMNFNQTQQHGWAIPTATDIAFAIGVLALLGKSIPSNIRVFLLALAIIDDIIAVLIIAFFYSGGLNYSGFLVVGIGILIIFLMQKIRINSAFAYLIPGSIVWLGLLKVGVHPAIGGVLLGLITPVIRYDLQKYNFDSISHIARELKINSKNLSEKFKEMRLVQRHVLPPVTRVEAALHPWVVFGIMPLFALANAGVNIGGMSFTTTGSLWIIVGIFIALVFGKPMGIVGVSVFMVRMGWCKLPIGVSWRGIILIGLLAGIGFTMSIFIAMLAFSEQKIMLDAAKIGILSGSCLAGILGISWGFYMKRNQ